MNYLTCYACSHIACAPYYQMWYQEGMYHVSCFEDPRRVFSYGKRTPFYQSALSRGEEQQTRNLCNDCIYAIEKQALTLIPVEELPLWINTWLTERAEEDYRKRLETLEVT